MKIVGEIEAESVVRLSGPERYEYFVKWVAESEVAWALWQDGWALMADEAGNEGLPVWPALRFASESRIGDFDGYSAREISLDELRSLASSLEKERRGFAVFPTPNSRAPIIAANQLIESIDAYIEEWY